MRIDIDRKARSAVIDFTGTSPQQHSNFNAPSAVCKAAVLYVFRTLVDDDIPMNEGCLKPLEIVIPAGCMLSPRYPAAVVAGNVETSQVITDTLYGALGLMGASQGTMNNFTFGNERYQYYETICGGSGAGPDFDGTDAVHTHMTNSRLTDPEVLEWRYPVLVRELRHPARQRRQGPPSRRRRRRAPDQVPRGHDGRHPLRPPPGRRPTAWPAARPAPSAGTTSCAPTARPSQLGATGKVEMNPGDVFVIETPGGGGYGRAEERKARGIGAKPARRLVGVAVCVRGALL